MIKIRCRFRQIQRPIQTIGLYILLFFVIYSTDTMIVAMNVNHQIKNISHMIVILLMFGSILLFTYKSYFFDHTFIFMFLACIFLFASMIYNEDFTGGYILKIILFIVGYFFTRVVDFKKFSLYYMKCIYIIAVFSVLGFCLAYVMPPLKFFPVIVNVAGNKYSFTLFNNIILTPNPNRNYGPFWEPGVYQAYVNIALLFYFFVPNHGLSKKYIIVYVIAVLTTVSTTGYVVLFLIFVSNYFKNNIFRITLKKVMFIFFITLGIIGITISPIGYTIFRKFSTSSYEFNSFFSRFYSIISNIQIILKYPLWGVGPNNVAQTGKTLFDTLNLFTGFTDTAQTNAILLNFSMFGFYVGIFYLTNLMRFIAMLTKNWFVKFLFICLLCIILFTEPLTYSLFFHIIIYYHKRNNNF